MSEKEIAEDEETTPWHSYEPMERYNSLFPILPEFVAHYTVGLEYGDTIGLPDKYSLRLRREILAALVADKLRIGTEYAKRRYTEIDHHSRWLGLTDRIDRIYNQGRESLGWYVSFQRDQTTESENSFHDLSVQFFYRSMGSLDAAKRLSELGYLCEVANILRSALEQFAFCSRLLSLNGTEDLRAVRPVQSLNYFKNFVPAAGKLYGLMSKYTHFEYDHHTHFFTHGSNQVQTIRQGPVLRAYSTHLLLITMACVGKYIIAAAPTLFKNAPKSVLDINTFIQNVSEYSDDICRILSLDAVLASMDMLLQDVIGQDRA